MLPASVHHANQLLECDNDVIPTLSIGKLQCCLSIRHLPLQVVGNSNFGRHQKCSNNYTSLVSLNYHYQREMVTPTAKVNPSLDQVEHNVNCANLATVVVAAVVAAVAVVAVVAAVADYVSIANELLCATWRVGFGTKPGERFPLMTR